MQIKNGEAGGVQIRMLLNYDELIERRSVYNAQEATNTYNTQYEFPAFQTFTFFFLNWEKGFGLGE